MMFKYFITSITILILKRICALINTKKEIKIINNVKMCIFQLPKQL